MAFYRNYSSEPVSDGVLDEKGPGPGTEKVDRIAGNVDGNLSDRDFDINLNAEYRSDGEADDGGKFQLDVGDGRALVDLQPSTRKMTSSGKWGSTFWKDCQPMRPGSDSGHESKSSSEFKNGEGSEDESLGVREDGSESEDPDTVRRRQADVPVDEMPSDDYYEQDGDERPNDLIHHKLGNNLIALNSNSKPRPVVADMYQSRKSKALNDDEYGDDDADYEDDGDGNSIFHNKCLHIYLFVHNMQYITDIFIYV